ncbi:hypothetical protein C2I36_02920 [Rhodobacteraceae bacterium WD3A24]|nr:hypothetical protein C2I36_02920 [Rhodobacteraceae bacterium WD3A24]
MAFTATETPATPLRDSAAALLGLLRRGVSAYAEACALRNAVEELWGLSDAELRRRGLTRSEIARHAFNSVDARG